MKNLERFVVANLLILDVVVFSVIYACFVHPRLVTIVLKELCAWIMFRGLTYRV